MIPVLQALPFDKTGKNPNNRTKGEIHDLTPQFDLPYRIVVMEKGYFYTNDLFIMDNRGRVLKEDIDYQCLLMEADIAGKYGNTACAIIVITNPVVSNVVYVEAQMVGGQYCSLNTAILEQAANVIRGANRKVLWRNIKNKPNTFKPSGHLHALWELFGFTPQTAIIHRMTTAMDKSSSNIFDGLYEEFTNKLNAIKDDLQTIEDRLTTHIQDLSNPHRLTAIQVELDYVYNAPPATFDQAQQGSGTLMNTYATALRAAQSVAVNFTPSLQGHIDDLNNPHEDTAAKLGTMTTIEMNQLANQYYNRGSTVDRSNGLGGLTWDQYYTDVRSNIPAVNLVSGIMPWSLFAGSAPPAGYIAVPSANGTLTWRSIAEIFDIYEKKGNMILYAGSMDYNTSPSAIAGILGVNHPVGTIAILRSYATYTTFTGNGAIVYTTLSTLAMATLQAGNPNRWVSPGWR